MKTFKLILYIFLCINNTFAVTLHVPLTFPTIQAALDSCQTGDSVVVQPGTYTESLTWPQVSDIKLIGIGGSASTIILAAPNDRVLLINNPSLDTNTVIKGFTFSGGYLLSGHGAGVHVYWSTVLFEDVTISDNHIDITTGHGYGAGLYMYVSNSVLRNCLISQNVIESASFGHGAGVYIYGGNPLLKNVIVTDNSVQADTNCSGFGIYASSCDYLIMEEVEVTYNTAADFALGYYGNGMYIDALGGDFSNVLVAWNTSGFSGPLNNAGGGIFVESSVWNLNFINCTIAENSKAGNGPITGIGMYNNSAAVILVNCIFYNNYGNSDEIYNATFAYMDVHYCNIRGGYAGTGVGITVLPPQFVSTTDFHLLHTSPNAGTGTDIWYPPIDLDGFSRPLPLGTMPDRGCYEVDQSTIGFNETESSEEMILFPNPAHSILNIEIIAISQKNISLELFNSFGQKVRVLYEGEIHSNMINAFNISTLPPGIYFVKLNDKTPTVNRFVKL